MEKQYLKLLRCPLDKGKLNLTRRAEGEGVFLCSRCGTRYPLLDGVPRLMPPAYLEAAELALLKGKTAPRPARGIWRKGLRGYDADPLSRLLQAGSSASLRFRDAFLAGLLSRAGKKATLLDIGCGEIGAGDVNTDVYLPDKPPPNFVRAHAQHLPFADGSFDASYSAYVIEHCPEPTSLLLEQRRVCRRLAIVVTDNSEWLGDAWFRLAGRGRIFHDEHYYKFSVEYLANLLSRLGLGKSEVRAATLSPTPLVRLFSLLGSLPRVGVWFHRDLVAVIKK